MDETLAIALAQGLRAARLRLGLTQAETAEAARLAPEVYGRMERGRLLPSLPAFHALCTVLCVSPDTLLRGTKPPW